MAGLFIYAAVAAVLLRDTLLKLMRRPAWNPASAAVLFALLGYGMLKAHPDSRSIHDAWQPEYASIRGVREDLARLCPTIPKGSVLLIAQEPLNESYSTYFLIQLLYRDSSSVIHQFFRFDVKPEAAAIAGYNYVFGFEKGRVVRLDPAEAGRRFGRK